MNTICVSSIRGVNSAICTVELFLEDDQSERDGINEIKF